VTDDGYVITMFRIPARGVAANSTPVMLQHGVLDSAFTWVINGPQRSLAYILADAGYDVWMGNSRGNAYGRRHVTLDPESDSRFWSFSWDEMASHDLPAQLELVCNVTGVKGIPLVAHSQGTTQVFAGMNTVHDKIRPLIKSFVALGPVANVSHHNLPYWIHVLSHRGDWAPYGLFGRKSWLDFPKWILNIASDVCSDVPYLCMDIYQWILGRNPGAWDSTKLALSLQYVPAVTSVQNMVHWMQLVRGDFRRHDYGREENLKRYGVEVPPPYDISLFPADLPTLLVSGGADSLANPEDVKSLLAQLPGNNEHIFLPAYAHLDYMWSVSAHVELYPELLRFLNEHR
jgi:pimeloyl-ACP methyl ester carboxylesterase